MKKIASLCSIFALLFSQHSIAQNFDVPQGFDVRRSDVAQGHIDTIHYASTTVGTERRAIVYTPPGFSPGKKYPVLCLLHGIGGDEFEWLNNGHPQVIL